MFESKEYKKYLIWYLDDYCGKLTGWNRYIVEVQKKQTSAQNRQEQTKKPLQVIGERCWTQNISTRQSIEVVKL